MNTNNNILVIQTPEGEYLAFRLTNDTALVSEAGHEAGIEDLSFGVNVSVEYDAQTKNVLELTVLLAPEENVSAPLPEENVSAPLPEENVSAPLPEENVSAPLPEENVSAPLPEENVSAPLPEENVPLEP